MKKYTCTIKFTAPYLQARFSMDAKKELVQDTKKTILKKKEDDSWKNLSYQDEIGFYIPALQLEGAFIASGKDFKMKAKRSSLSGWIKASLFADVEKFYLNKKEPDFINESFPKRKDGNRVRILHPAFNAGTQFTFTMQCLDDEIEDGLVQKLLENAGLRYGLGAWRPRHGRFEVVSVKEDI